jgi:hypothetical protein
LISGYDIIFIVLKYFRAIYVNLNCINRANPIFDGYQPVPHPSLPLAANLLPLFGVYESKQIKNAFPLVLTSIQTKPTAT